MTSADIYNYIKVNDAFITGGQPTVEQFKSLAAEGFSTIINLATFDPPYALANEAELVHSLGMTYFHIPVEWDDPKDSDFTAFEQIMQQLPAGKTLIHCIANFRVTAFYSLYARKHLGWSEAEADDFRAKIWKGSDNPAWRAFIARIQAQIADRP